MNKFLIPVGALIALGIGFTLCCFLYYSSMSSRYDSCDRDENAAHQTYEMPKFVPAVWAQGH